MNNIQVPTMTPPVQVETNAEQTQLNEREMSRQFLIQLKNSTDPQKWNFIEEIKALAEQQNNYQHSTMEAILMNSQKSIHDLFYIKYDLSLNTLIVTDLLINFRDICRSLLPLTPSAKHRTRRGSSAPDHHDISQ